MTTTIHTGEPTRLPVGTRPRTSVSGLGRTGRWLLGAAVGLLGLGTAQGQGFNLPTQGSTTFTALTATDGAAITTASFDDSNSAAQSIGFGFVFNGVTFTQFVLNTNGFIRMGALPPSATNLFSSTTATAGGPINSASGSDVNIIAPFNTDLEGGTGTPEYRVAISGTSPNQVCTIQWANVSDKASTSVKQYNNFSFQIKLYEATGTIDFVYAAPTISANAATAKVSSVGIKGGIPSQSSLLTKASGTAWNAPSIQPTGPYTGNGFNFRNSTGATPVSGQFYRYTKAPANDATTTAIYTLTKLPIPSGAPHVVKAVVTNAGSATIPAITATLTVTGPSPATTVVFTDTQSSASAVVGSQQTLSFAGYTPPSTGTYAVKVQVAADGNAANDSKTVSQVVNATDYSYILPGNPTSAKGFGPTVTGGAQTALFNTTTAVNITGIRAQIVDFIGSGGGSTLGKTVYAALFNPTTGAEIAGARSANRVITAADLTATPTVGSLVTFPLSTPVTIPAGNFMVGLVQAYQTGETTQYFALGVQNESPSRPGTFFSIIPPAAPVDATTANSLNMLEAITAPAPSCVPPTGVAVGSITDTGASVSFTGDASATGGYTVNYTPSGGTMQTVTPTPTGSPVALSGLIPGTTYAVSVISNCAGGQTSATSTSFTTLFSNDASVAAIYTLGRIPATYGGPHAVRARITNTGQNTLTAVNVVLTISGANSFTDTQPVTLTKGQSVVVTFADFTPTVAGTNTVAVAVADDNAANNASQSQEVNTTTFSYCAPNPTTGGAGVGFGTSGIFAAKYTTSASRQVTAVTAFLVGAATVGKTVRGVLLDATGTIIASSADYVVQAADINTLHSFTLPGTVIIGASTFYVGLGQTAITGTAYFPIGTQTESPTRTAAFYTFPLTGGTPNDASTSNSGIGFGRYIIEAVTTALPACLPPTALTFTNPTATSVTVGFTASASAPANYTITYTPTGSSAQPVTTATNSANITGLSGSTTYSFSVVSNCAGNGSSAALTGTFTTVPANDQCSNAITVTCGSSVTGTTVGSTGANGPTGNVNDASGSPVTPYAAQSGGVYYRFVGTGEKITVGMCSSAAAYDAELFVYQANCGNFTSLTGVIADDDGCSGGGGMSTVTFLSTTGAVYYIFVSGFYSAAQGAARGAFTLTTSCASPDLVVTGPQTISGTYRNVTIANGGNAVLGGDLNVVGTMTVQSGGTLTGSALYYAQGPGRFVLNAGGTLIEPNSAGLTNDGSGSYLFTGTPAMTFSNDANYVFNGTSAQTTGALLPAQARNLTVNNTAGIAANRTLTLTSPLAVRQVARLQQGNLVTGSNAFTLISERGVGTALIDNTGGVVTGTGTMQRAVDVSTPENIGYHHYSSPVAATTLNDLAAPVFTPVFNTAFNTAAAATQVRPFPTVQSYDQARIATSTAAGYGTDLSAFDKGFFSPSGSDAWTPGHGYTANVPNAAVLDFVGTFNNAAVSITGLVRDAGADAGWQLLGNPYPSPLDWSSVTNAQLNNMDATMYIWHASSRYGGAYTSYLTNGVSNTGSGSGSPVIDAGAGFFARVTNPGTGSLNLANANRVTTFAGQPSFGRSGSTLPLLSLQVRGTGGTDAIAVYAETNATTGVDARYDATKLFNPTGLNLAALTGSTALSIDALPALTAATVVPLRLGVPAAGTYALTLTQVINLGANQVYLRDAVAGTTTRLTAGTPVSVTLTNVATATTRFSLVFRPAGALATAAGLTAGQVSLFPNPAHGSFSLLLPPVAGAKEVNATLLNALGQVVSARTIALTAAGATAEFNTSALAQGVYMLRLTAGSETLTQRVVVE